MDTTFDIYTTAIDCAAAPGFYAPDQDQKPEVALFAMDEDLPEALADNSDDADDLPNITDFLPKPIERIDYLFEKVNSSGVKGAVTQTRKTSAGKGAHPQIRKAMRRGMSYGFRYGVLAALLCEAIILLVIVSLYLGVTM